MSPFGCAREKEVASLLKRGHWPQACTDELRAHVAGCRVCGDLALVTGTLEAARAETMPAARLEPAGALWWRAQLRRRNTAVARMGRPILGAQIFALALAVLVAAGAAALELRRGVHVVEWFRALNLAALLPTSLLPTSLLGSGLWWLVPVLATLALAGGVAVYLATENEP